MPKILHFFSKYLRLIWTKTIKTVQRSCLFILIKWWLLLKTLDLAGILVLLNYIKVN